jgi:hypothetical protein
MVKGWDTFRQYLAEFPNSYVIIGGTAMQHALDAAPKNSRTTKDIDIVLIIDVLDDAFMEAFWKMITDGEYATHHNVAGNKNKKYWKFKDPAGQDFPGEIEIFSGKLDLPFPLMPGAKFTPVPADGDVPSLSAILMDQDYYEFLNANHSIRDDVKLANNNALICLKAKAWLDLRERKKTDPSIDKRKVVKHKNDVFRLVALLAPDTTIAVPDSIKADLSLFASEVEHELPEAVHYKEMGMVNVKSEDLLKLFKNVFGIQ